MKLKRCPEHNALTCPTCGKEANMSEALEPFSKWWERTLDAHDAPAAEAGTLSENDLYAAYANHCAIESKVPLTFYSWKREQASAKDFS